MKKIDIRNYSDEELALQVLNDEGLWRFWVKAIQKNDFSIMERIVDEMFVYNSSQLALLKDEFYENQM
ncbi:MAG: hypothetical protein WBJ22_01430 [Minisyncoccales bacterium]